MPELVSCPHCGKSLRVPDNLVGRTVKCPGCEAAFTVTAADDAPPVKGDRAEQPRRRRPEDEEGITERPRKHRGGREDEEDGEEYSRPRRSRDGGDEEDLEDDRPRRRGRGRRAAAAVATPAIALLVVGILGILMGMGNIAALLAGFGLNAQQQNDAAVKSGRLVGAAVSLIWGVVVALGGFKMKSLQSRGSAITAAVVAIVPCNPCCLFGLPVGIWALIVLSKPEVKRAFS